jgi:hypothetical protein
MDVRTVAGLKWSRIADIDAFRVADQQRRL